MKKALVLVVLGFVGVCGWMIFDALAQSPALDSTLKPLTLLQETTTTPAVDPPVQAVSQPVLSAAQSVVTLNALGGEVQSVQLGSTDKDSGYKYQLDLTSTGAALKTASFSEWDNRARTDAQPLSILQPAAAGNGRQVMSLASQALLLYNYDQKLSLDKLAWKLTEFSAKPDSVQTAQFEATIVAGQTKPALLIRKTYTVQPNTYLFDVKVEIVNQTSDTQKVAMNLTGPVGLEKEGFRQDMRNTVALYKKADGEFSKVAPKSLYKADATARKLEAENSEASLLWVAAINKYFAAIVVPQPDSETQGTRWLAGHSGVYFNPDDVKKPNGDETIGLNLSTTTVSLAPNGQHTYNFQIYLGPKDKNLFDDTPMYKNLGFVHTISFMGCCCPRQVIYPMAFGILWTMKAMYGIIGNYGLVIIILVLVMRLILHPVTKKSQISMHKMSKLAPRSEEIKKKYATNKAEMNRQMMLLYKEQGASPIMGFLPMMIQMPVWISLWSAINASVDLRGKGLLPFWITDLSVPDALIPFTPFTLPLFGTIDSFNLLPVLMGVAFYLQQKLMPSQANAANPQMAQQQKMMAIMMPIMFPLMLYKVPSGVNLYIMTSTALGVWEQTIIRKHIKEKEALENKGLVSVTSKTGGKVKKKKPKPMFKQF
ncbi:MAG: membrane protein insertase YidC [Phycisphaeraceae bacterium]|nr:membrane protein insertase YidC [Phycisphaeraceae bacterium]